MRLDKRYVMLLGTAGAALAFDQLVLQSAPSRASAGEGAPPNATGLSAGLPAGPIADSTEATQAGAPSSGAVGFGLQPGAGDVQNLAERRTRRLLEDPDWGVPRLTLALRSVEVSEHEPTSRPEPTSTAPVARAVTPLTPPVVSGVIGGGRPAAIIEGVTVRVGESVLGWRLVQIDAAFVTLERDGVRRRVGVRGLESEAERSGPPGR